MIIHQTFHCSFLGIQRRHTSHYYTHSKIKALHHVRVSPEQDLYNAVQTRLRGFYNEQSLLGLSFKLKKITDRKVFEVFKNIIMTVTLFYQGILTNLD